MTATRDHVMPSDDRHQNPSTLRREPLLVLTAGGADASRYGPAHVLLVTSDPRDQGRIGGPLRDAGCHVQAAFTVEQAKAIVCEGSVDVIITSEQLADGTWQDLRTHCNDVLPYVRTLGIIVILGHADPARSAHLLELGAADTLMHPIDRQNLLRTMTVVHARVMRAREIGRARMSNPGVGSADPRR